MKFNPFDGDRAADAYDEEKGRQECKSILSAFNLGQKDRRDGKPYNNLFNKKTQRFKHVAYRNGYGK